ncbi:MAG TPA: GNAT family N-acetyltransferase [Pseudomonadales bacterium]|nr:GNAT family N-acetyltransferase [Pseudomonadales bacterium]
MTPSTQTPRHPVRDATPADVDALVAFNRAMALETEDKVLDDARLHAGVARLLGDASLGRYFVVDGGDGQPAGALAITYEWSDWRCGTWFWIQSVYVRPEARRSGVFQALYAHVEAAARAQPDCCGLRLYVEQDNSRAMATYTALGMEETHYRLYEAEFSG